MSSAINMTYSNCKKLIEIRQYESESEKEEMLNKLDVFLLNNRITQEEYNELVSMINTK